MARPKLLRDRLALWHPISKCLSLMCCMVLYSAFTCLLAVPSGVANGAQNADKFDGVPKVLYAKDGWPIHITYSESQRGKDAPVVVLLHGKGDRQLPWLRPKGFAAYLESKGYAVIAVDLRKHGLSKQSGGSSGNSTKKSGDASSLRTVDYQAMVLFDMEAIKKFILQEHQAGNLNMRKLAIVAPEMSTAIALVFSASDWSKVPYDDAPTLSARTPRGQDVHALVLLSPVTTLPRVNSIRAITFLKDPAKRIAFWIGVGKTDSLDKGTAKKLYQQLGGEAPTNKGRIEFHEFPSSLRGTQLLGKGAVEASMAKFLDEHINNLPVEWRDRASRI